MADCQECDGTGNCPNASCDEPSPCLNGEECKVCGHSATCTDCCDGGGCAYCDGSGNDPDGDDDE